MWEGLTRISQTASKSSNIDDDDCHNELIEGISRLYMLVWDPLIAVDSFFNETLLAFL